MSFVRDRTENEERLRRSVAALFVAAAITVVTVSLLFAGCGGASGWATTAGGSTGSSVGAASVATTASTVIPTTDVHQDTGADLYSPAQEVLNGVYASVVNIRVEVTVGGQTGGGVGSGVVYTSDGLILTNAHVVTLDNQVTSGQKITVTFSDGSTAPATIVGTDNQKDVAAIQVQKSGLKPVTFGSSKDVQLAEWAIVIGSPLDFRNSVTLGIVSGLNRTLDTGTGTPPLTGLMQVDTPISPGNSGGGCFDARGMFIGMPEVYLPPAQTGAENIGFCIPADTVAGVAKTLTGK